MSEFIYVGMFLPVVSAVCGVAIVKLNIHDQWELIYPPVLWRKRYPHPFGYCVTLLVQPTSPAPVSATTTATTCWCWYFQFLMKLFRLSIWHRTGRNLDTIADTKNIYCQRLKQKKYCQINKPKSFLMSSKHSKEPRVSSERPVFKSTKIKTKKCDIGSG